MTVIAASRPSTVEPCQPDEHARGQKRESGEDHARGKPVERFERGQPETEEPGIAAREPPVLVQVQQGRGRGDGERGERREHQAGVQRERPPVAVALFDTGPATRPGDDQEERGDGHDGEPQESIAGPAAPDEVGRDDEPREQVERARPGSPGESLGRQRLDDEQRGLGEPADPNAPDP